MEPAVSYALLSGFIEIKRTHALDGGQVDALSMGDVDAFYLDILRHYLIFI